MAQGAASTKKAAAASWEEQARLLQLARPAKAGNSSVVSAVEAGTPGQARKKLDPYAQFEAFVLQSFIQAMLPSDASSVYGTGTAGQIWRSMLAENMATEIARTGGVGIAERVRGTADARSQDNGPSPDSTAGVAAPQATEAVTSEATTTKVPAPDQSSAPADAQSEIWPAAIVKPA